MLGQRSARTLAIGSQTARAGRGFHARPAPRGDSFGTSGALGRTLPVWDRLASIRRFPEAIEVFRQLVQVRPDHPDVHNNLGVAYQALGEYEQASREFLEAIGLRSDFDRAYLNLGRLKEQQGHIAEAERWYRRGAELKPGIRTHWLHLAGALGKQNKWAEVERVLRQTVDVEPDNLDLQVNLAYALIQRERLRKLPRSTTASWRSGPLSRNPQQPRLRPRTAGTLRRGSVGDTGAEWSCPRLP